LKDNVKITILGIILNTVLFAIKLSGGVMSGSLALLSDSFNSLMDTMSSIAIFLAVKIGTKKADLDHPFGHQRAEPIAGLLVATLAAILGFEVMKNAFQGFFIQNIYEINLLIFSIIGASIGIKMYMFLLFRIRARNTKSPALMASSVDYRNDILVSFSVLLGILFVYLGHPVMDNIVAICIGAFIIYSGFKIGMENIDFLMGKKPGDKIMERLKNQALSIDGVKRLNDVRAHYLGNFIQVEIHIEVDKRLSTEDSHHIAKEVQNLLQQEEGVDFAFVHVDPV